MLDGLGLLMVSTTPDEHSQVFMVMGEDVSKSVVCMEGGGGEGGRGGGRKTGIRGREGGREGEGKGGIRGRKTGRGRREEGGRKE